VGQKRRKRVAQLYIVTHNLTLNLRITVPLDGIARSNEILGCVGVGKIKLYRTV
jgi:hypothetical protein